MNKLKKNKLTLAIKSDREVIFMREFNAPRELVFDAFTTKEHLERWWGLRSTTTRIEALDFRPGGAWRFVERTGDGNEYVFYGKFLEIIRPEKFVWTFEYRGAPGQISQTSFQFSEANGKTKLSATVLFASTAERDEMVKAGMERGAAESYEMLDELLIELQRK